MQPQVTASASGVGTASFDDPFGGPGSAHLSRTELMTDFNMLQDSFDSLFTSTLLFDNQSITELICALAQLTVGVLENLNPLSLTQSQRSTAAAEGEILAQINTFAMSRLVETALVNVSRIDNIWKIIVAHFDILSNCQVLAIRQLTIEALQTIVLEVFAHKKTLQPSKGSARGAREKPSRPRHAKTGSYIGENVSDDDLDEKAAGQDVLDSAEGENDGEEGS